jgi:hypothetical protein
MARELSRGRVVAVLAVCGMLVQVAGAIPVTAASAARVVSATTGGPLLAGGAVSASALAASSGSRWRYWRIALRPAPASAGISR